MGTGSGAQELRRGTNPLFNDRKLKLGTFCTNLDYGAAITTIEGTLRISSPATLALAKLAEEMEFEALARLRRGHQLQRRRLRVLLLGGRHRRLDELSRDLRHLARADRPSNHGRQAGRGHRPHHQ